MSTRFIVNGAPREVQASPAARLADVLRDDLGLTGTKIGCNAGDCGACTVLVDGRQVCACITSLGHVEGRAVTTIEGLPADGVAGRLKQAFHVHGAAQCGICTPGMLMAAADLLARNARPGAIEVEDALGGVLCRCTGYRKIVDAVLDVADGALIAPQAQPGAAVGSRVPKVDGLAKLSGAEKYGADLAPAGALWLRVIRSPHERARFTLGDLGALRQRFALVLTAADVPNNAFGVFTDLRDQPVFADGHVRFRGEAVLAVVGERAAVEALDEADVPIRWEPLAPRTTIEAGLAGTDAPLHAYRPDNVLIHGRAAIGDVEAGMAKAAAVAEGRFTTSFVEHAYIEPEAGYAERVGDRVHIFVTTQSPYLDRDEVAHILALRKDQVRIVPSAVGGGFGGKLDLSVHPFLALAAWKLGKPVRMVYTRPESMATTPKRHPADIRMRIGCAADGRIVAVDFDGDFNTGAYASWGTTVANRVPIHAPGPYFVENARCRTRAVYTNAPIAGAFRGFGIPQSTIAHEALLDTLAERLDIDALELRHRNAIRPGQWTITRQKLAASCGLAACLDALRPHWRAARAAAAAFNASQPAAVNASQPPAVALTGKRRGVGVACMWYGIGNTVVANPSAMRASLKADGRIMFYNGAVDIGQGSNTTLMQVLADALGLPMSAIDYVMGDTDRTLDAGKSSASRQAYVSGNATKRAGEALRKRMLQLVEAAPDATLALEDGWLIARDAEGEKRINVTELPRDKAGDILVAEGHWDPPTTALNENGEGVPYSTYAFAAQIAEVEVDLALGTTKVLRIVAAHDVGRSLNPREVEGQIHGGIVQGLGLALMEEYHAGRTENLHDYLIPTFGDVPPIDVILVEDPEPLGPHGAKGVGEPALIPTAPAIFGAIRHATGVRVTHAPATPARLRAALAGNQGAR